MAFERVVEESLRTRRHAIVCLLPDVQSLALCRLAGAGWRSCRVYATCDQHAREAVEAASSRDWLRPSLSGALQVFPRGNRRLLLPSRPLRGAERSACKPRGASGSMALVELATCGARRPGVSDSLGVAFAASRRLGTNGQPTADGSRAGIVALLRQSRSALRRSELGCRCGQTIGARMDASTARKTEEAGIKLPCYPDLVAVTFPWCHLSSFPFPFLFLSFSQRSRVGDVAGRWRNHYG